MLPASPDFPVLEAHLHRGRGVRRHSQLHCTTGSCSCEKWICGSRGRKCLNVAFHGTPRLHWEVSREMNGASQHSNLAVTKSCDGPSVISNSAKTCFFLLQLWVRAQIRYIPQTFSALDPLVCWHGMLPIATVSHRMTAQDRAAAPRQLVPSGPFCTQMCALLELALGGRVGSVMAMGTLVTKISSFQKGRSASDLHYQDLHLPWWCSTTVMVPNLLSLWPLTWARVSPCLFILPNWRSDLGACSQNRGK